MKVFVFALLASAFALLFPQQSPRASADGEQTLKISDDGAVFDGETVVERAGLDGGGFRLVTVKRGSDNDREALFRFTYTLEGETFSIKKEVRPEGAAEFFERNTYSWKR